jgi:hypothetical protein
MNKYKESRRERRCQRFVSRDLAFHWTVSVPGSSRASVIHSVAAVALAIAIVGVAGVSRATDEQFGNYFYCICRLPFARSHWIGTRNCQFGWLRGSRKLLKRKDFLVAGACNHSNSQVLPFSLELIRPAA